MTKKTAPVAVEPATDAPVTADAFHGQGGSYIVNPVTGARELVSRTGLEKVVEPTAATPVAALNGGDHADVI